MLHPYRVLKQNFSLNKVERTYFYTLIDAYKACIPEPDCCCRLLFNGLQEKMDNKESLVKVTCYIDSVYWIECLIGKAEPFLLPDLPSSKIDCGCHC
jgi:hypothetical protein